MPRHAQRMTVEQMEHSVWIARFVPLNRACGVHGWTGQSWPDLRDERGLDQLE